MLVPPFADSIGNKTLMHHSSACSAKPHRPDFAPMAKNHGIDRGSFNARPDAIGTTGSVRV
jgi:hypothetical protein